MVNLSTKITELSKEYRRNSDKEILKELRALREFRNSQPSRIRTGTRIHYVRYADD